MRIVLFAATLVALSAPASAATRNIGIQGFEKLRVEGPYTVVVKTGVAPFARAIGSQSAIDRVMIDVRGKTLLVRSALGSTVSNQGNQGEIKIEIGTHELNAAALTGSGSMAIDKVRGLSFDLSVQGSGGAEIAAVDVDQFNVGLAGNAGARLRGQVKNLKAVLRGLSTLDTVGLKTTDAKFTGEGPISVRALVANSATIDARGAATFALVGGPSCTLKLQGSASTTGCK